MSIHETIRDKQANSAILPATGRTLQSESFLEKIIQSFLESDRASNSFATHAKHDFDKVLNDRQVVKNLAKAVVKLFNRIRNVAKV